MRKKLVYWVPFLLYVISLFTPVVEYQGVLGYGLSMLLLGFVGLIYAISALAQDVSFGLEIAAMIFPWFGNLAFLWAILATVLNHLALALALSVIALAIQMTYLLNPYVLAGGPEIHTMSYEMGNVQIGFYIWLSATVGSILLNIFLLGERKKSSRY